MTQQGILEEVIGRLAELGIPYALTGSYASTYWGRPRSTHGIDMVVLIDGDQARRLANVVGPDYYADAEAMAHAAATAGHFNLIHYETGVKIDFWISRDEGYDEERFSRRLAPDEQRPELVVLAAEDVILSKLLFAAGMGPLGFSLLRFFLFASFKNNQVWFEFWEEATELLFIAGVGIALWIFRDGLLRDGREASRLSA